jgi:L-ribulose-5-phosphate 4-epimerase
MTEEGYIKFKAHWKKGAPLPAAELTQLQHWRNRLYELKLIGAYDGGIGYGNLSRRWDAKGRFLITGSATGNEAVLEPRHYALVTEVDIARNSLQCEGPVMASSESMSHAVIYRECAWVGGVIHVHHPGMWERLLHQAPTTDAEATYGSPEMAYSIIDLLENTDLPRKKIFVMEGHREGIFTFGKDLDEAGAVLLRYFNPDLERSS